MDRELGSSGFERWHQLADVVSLAILFIVVSCSFFLELLDSLFTHGISVYEG